MLGLGLLQTSVEPFALRKSVSGRDTLPVSLCQGYGTVSGLGLSQTSLEPSVWLFRVRKRCGAMPGLGLAHARGTVQCLRQS